MFLFLIGNNENTTTTTKNNSNNDNNKEHSSSRWRVDYAAELSVGWGWIDRFEFKMRLVLDETGRRFPLMLYLESPATHGQNANKLHLLACKKVPEPVRLALHPGAFRPRRTTAGWAFDLRRGRHMWLP